MVDATSNANAALGRAVTAANEALIRQDEFGKQVRRLHQQVIQDLEASKTDTQSYLGNMRKQVSSAIQTMTQQLSDKFKDLGSEASDVKEVLRSSTKEAEELKSNIARVFQQAVEGSAELAATHAKHWEATSSSTVDLRDSLHELRDQEVNSLLGAFGSIHNQLVSCASRALFSSAKAVQQASNELVAVMYSRQNEMDKRLINLDKSFAGLESTAAALHAIQTSDAEAQLRLHNQMQTDLQVAQSLLADITASAASLQASVHDTSSKVTNMVAFGGLSSTVLNWGWSLIMVLVLYQFHPKLGGYAAVVLGAFLLVTISGPPPFIRYFHAPAEITVSGHTASSERIYYLLLCVIGISGIVLLFHFCPRLPSLARSVSHQAKSSLHLGTTSPARAHHNWKI
ncbi:MAG: hypothetical protein LQ348_001682 [Seirophora lacunosa]|nr:MAG: hypothetical protein LQ348_001682 [Seirophora lacunosa]